MNRLLSVPPKMWNAAHICWLMWRKRNRWSMCTWQTCRSKTKRTIQKQATADLQGDHSFIYRWESPEIPRYNIITTLQSPHVIINHIVKCLLLLYAQFSCQVTPLLCWLTSSDCENLAPSSGPESHWILLFSRTEWWVFICYTMYWYMYKVFFKYGSTGMQNITISRYYHPQNFLFLILKDCSVLGTAYWLHPIKCLQVFWGIKHSLHSLQGGTTWTFKKKVWEMKIFTNRLVVLLSHSAEEEKDKLHIRHLKSQKIWGEVKSFPTCRFFLGFRKISMSPVPDRHFSGVSSGVWKVLVRTRLIDLF